MARYILRRLALIPIALIIVHFIGFSYSVLVRPLRAARNPYAATIIESPPLFEQYSQYLKGTLENQFGRMIAPRYLGGDVIPLLEGLKHAVVASLGLVGIALILSIILGISIGLISVSVEPPGVKRWLTSLSTIGLAMPSFYLGSLFFAGWFLYIIWKGPGTRIPLPFQGFGWDSHLIMPSLVLIARPTVQIAQITASLLSEEIGKQYVVAARSMGHNWRRIRSHTALRNIFAPVILSIAGATRILVTELIIVEWLFDWPGLGQLLAKSLIPSSAASTFGSFSSSTFLNPPLVAAVLSVFALLFLIVDIIASTLGRYFDPRLRIS